MSVGELQAFLSLHYSQRVNRDRDDWLCWLPLRVVFFEVKSFHKVLTIGNTRFSHAKASIKVPTILCMDGS
jgi:hypothetical protein